jgi:integrase
MRIKIKHLERLKDRYANIRLYYRNRNQNCRRIRLRGPEGSPEFWEDYVAAAKVDNPQLPTSREAPKAHTFRRLVEEYYGAAQYRRLAESTKQVRRRMLDRFCEKHGQKRYANLETSHLVRIRNNLSDKPEAANGLLKALRQVFVVAIELGLVKSNPAADVAYLKSKNTEGFHAWTIAEVEKYEATHPIGTKARLALALFLYTGQRKSDIVRMGRQHVRDGWISIRQQKTDMPVDIPIVSDLQRIIDASPTVTEFKKPFTANGFGNKMREWCDKAGLPQCSSHGLRKAMATRLADLGCTAHEISVIGGWATLKEVERYTKHANRKRLAAQAMAKIEG